MSEGLLSMVTLLILVPYSGMDGCGDPCSLQMALLKQSCRMERTS